MGADLFEDKFDGAVWALERLPADPLPPPGPNRPEIDADLHRALTALVEHGHDGPFRVLGAEHCAFMVLRSDWSWLRSHSGNLGLDDGDPLPHADGPLATDVSGASGAPDDPDVSHAVGRADVFDGSEGSGRADPADVTDPTGPTDAIDGVDAVGPAARRNLAADPEYPDGFGSADGFRGADRAERVDSADRPARADPSESPSPFPPGRPPVVESEADLERALAALDSQGFPDRAFALCRENGRKALAAVLSARAYDRPVAWLVEHAPKKVLRGLLSEVVMAVQQVRLTERVPERHVNSGFLPGIGEVLSRRRPRSVRGEKTLTLPTSVRRVVRGEHGTRVETEVVLPKAENSRTLEGPDGSEQTEGGDGASAPGGAESSEGPGARGEPVSGSPGPVGDGDRGSADDSTSGSSGSMFGPSSGPHGGSVPSADPVVGPRRGMPGQLATIRWEGFSRAWDDLGNRYVMLFEVEKGQPGLSSFLGTEVVTQTFFPALAEDAGQLMLLNPGHLVTRAPTIDGQVSGRPSVRTVPDGNVVTVNLRKHRKRRD
ncbi:hypothetical protein [Nocardiopsis salina]|uniref:hypothetical protein n=1 Tax=Nocardiopsis salina TaxID=245836 RepID=UPI000348C859|nr:hypothetical protein [Nocardiopsis salina]